MTVAQAGRRGGRAGRGASKRRTPEQYATAQAAATHARRLTAAANALAHCRSQADLDDAAAVIRSRWGEDILREALREKP